MSDIDGFDWWFRDRDYVLRDSVQSLQTETAAAHRRASRITSQLSKLQGSIDSRLTALTAAFDAYVELGDVREALAGYAESAAVRREAMTAIAALGEGNQPSRVDDRGTGYWIADATNAVIDRFAGSPDVGAEQRLTQEQPEAALFTVAANAVVGRAAELSEQAIQLLRPVDGRLGRHQLIIWRAMRADVFGPGVWQRVAAGWPAGAVREPAGSEDRWWSWARQQSAAGGADVLDWLEAQPGAPTAAAVSGGPTNVGGDDAVAELKDLVVEVIGAGIGEEAALLSRARELRERIEAPDPSVERDVEKNAGQQSATVVELLQQAYQESTPGSADRASLFALAAPKLATSLEEHASGFLTPQSATVKVTVPGGPVEVTPNGPDSQSMARHQAAARAMEPAGGRTLLIAGGIGVVAALLALVGAIASSTLLTVSMLIAVVVAGGVALRHWFTQRRDRENLQDRRSVWSASLAEGQEKARRIEAEQREIRRQRADQLDRLRKHLRTPRSHLDPGPQNAAAMGDPSVAEV